MSVFIIAEAGVNHNGDEAIARDLIQAAWEAGADAIKFQTFVPELIATHGAPKANYQRITTGEFEPQLEMLEKLQLSHNAFRRLQTCCKKLQISFLSTPFDLESVRFLHRELKLETLKIASGEITNGPLLLAAAQTGRNIILSTGMSTMDDVRDALSVLAFGYLYPNADCPSNKMLEQSFKSNEGQAKLAEKVSLLHCTTEYPAPFDEVNLLAIDGLKTAFGLPVGYSDHTPGIQMSVLAAARGATIIEKHCTLDKNMDGPDHNASIEPTELHQLVENIRQVERSLGTGIKRPSESEEQNLTVVRKSLVAAKNIKQGETFNSENLTAKRPATGISPMEIWRIFGQIAPREFQENEIIELKPNPIEQ